MPLKNRFFPQGYQPQYQGDIKPSPEAGDGSRSLERKRREEANR